ncbi:MAG: hypothetical protein MI799_15440 [Desulfobacterales bacterium]|nr:hypothetical protein [Desulfobacterales bacterium]
MLNVIMDLTPRCPRDMFFLSNATLFQELIVEITDMIHGLFQEAYLHLMYPQGALTLSTQSNYNATIDGSFTRNMQPEQDWRLILSHVKKSISSQGQILYINPLEGIVSRNRLQHMLSEIDEGAANILATQIPPNAHPLWASPVPLKYRRKEKLLFKRGVLKRIAENNRKLVPILQGETKDKINGSQQLAPIFKIDVSIIYINRSLFFSKNPADFSINIIPWNSCRMEWSDIHCLYHVPVFQMARDTQIGKTL